MAIFVESPKSIVLATILPYDYIKWPSFHFVNPPGPITHSYTVDLIIMPEARAIIVVELEVYHIYPSIHYTTLPAVYIIPVAVWRMNASLETIFNNPQHSQSPSQHTLFRDNVDANDVQTVSLSICSQMKERAEGPNVMDEHVAAVKKV